MNNNNPLRSVALRLLPVALLWGGASFNANALPAYARQTGDECSACHVGGYGPQLTPHGMAFKIGGYTDSDGNDGHIPLSAMVVANYTHVSGNLTDVPKHFDDNNNAALQEMSAFLAGRLADHVGSFTQVTYSDIDRKTAMDNMDIRAAMDVDGTIVGVSLNNNPGVTDPLDTLPVWRFPYTSPDLGGSGPSAAPVLDDALGGTVIGANVYAYTDTGIYGEAGLYRSLSQSQLDRLNVEPGQELSSPAGYWRLAYIKDLHKQAFSVGLVGMNARLRDYDSAGPSDNYNDIGVDAGYQFLGTRRHICTLDLTYLHEKQDLNAAFANGDAGRKSGNLNQLALTSSYYFANTYGFTARYFATSGSADALRYSSGKPDSNGYLLQADWTPFGKEDSWQAPWANVRLGLQYIGYGKIDGTRRNYDGNGRDAGDDNTLSLFLWSSI